MAESKNKKTKGKSEPGRLSRMFGWLKKHTEDPEAAPAKGDKKKGKGEGNERFVWGAVLALVAIYVLLAMISHLFTGADDQKLFQESVTPYTTKNWMGPWGAYAAHYIMDYCFGVSSILLPILLLATSVRIMNITKVRLHKWFLNCTVLMAWCSAFAAYVVAHVSFARDSYIVWGGMIGREEVNLMEEHIGQGGVLIALAIVFLLYLAYVSDETISTLRSWMTFKKDEDTTSDVTQTDGETTERENDKEDCTDETPEPKEPLMPF